MSKKPGKAIPDNSQQALILAGLISQLQQELANIQDPVRAPKISKEERAAARFLYEQIVNYKGLLHQRPLARAIEFVVNAKGPNFSQPGTGWYFQPPIQAFQRKGEARWVGPFSTHHEAELARLSNVPRTKMELVTELLFAD